LTFVGNKEMNENEMNEHLLLQQQQQQQQHRRLGIVDR